MKKNVRGNNKEIRRNGFFTDGYWKDTGTKGYASIWQRMDEGLWITGTIEKRESLFRCRSRRL